MQGTTCVGGAGVFMHGDKVSDPGNTSEGCIIIKRATRQEVDASDDKRLQVARQTLLPRVRRQIVRKALKVSAKKGRSKKEIDRRRWEFAIPECHSG
jgi:hypothetical protein